MDKFSYALGMSLAQNLLRSGVDSLEFEDLLDGMKAIYSGGDHKVSDIEANNILQTYFEKKEKEMEMKRTLESLTSKKNGEEYLKKNSGEDGVQTTKTGLQYKVIEEGTGKQPNSHSRVKCHYEGRFIDGTVFDSSFKRGEPATFGLDQVIPGWTEGLMLMKVGSKYEFTIPAKLRYGERGIPGHIPGNSVLIFTVELLSIE